MSLIASMLVWVGASGAEIPQAAVTQVDEALQNVTTLIRPKEVGYATIWIRNEYVQCRRLPDRTLGCEAAGALIQPSLDKILTSERIKALNDRNWVLDTNFGLYARRFPADMPTETIARQILDALANGYGADLSKVAVMTAWVPDQPCPPRNGYSQNLAGMVTNAETMMATALRECSYKPRPRQPKSGTREDVLLEYTSRVASEVQRLRINRRKDNIFVILQAGIGYVQCAPGSVAQIVYCEAQSEEQYGALTAILTPDRVAKLHAAGYADPGSAPNYWKDYDPTSSNHDIAIELLSILTDVYGYTGTPQLKILAN